MTTQHNTADASEVDDHIFDDEWGTPKRVITGEVGINVEGDAVLEEFQVGEYVTGCSFGFVSEFQTGDDPLDSWTDDQLLAIAMLENVVQNAKNKYGERLRAREGSVAGQAGIIEITSLDEMPTPIRKALEKMAPEILEKLQEELDQHGKVLIGANVTEVEADDSDTD